MSQLGNVWDNAAMESFFASLKAEYPAFAADIPATFERYVIAPEISARLIADLDAAGLPPHVQ
jgi:transposase InsO family protein